MTERFNAALIRIARAAEAKLETGPMTLQRAATLAVAEAGQGVLKTSITVHATEQADLPVDELPELLPEDALLVGLHSRGRLIGAIAMDLTMLTCTLQAQTSGQVQTGEIPPRTPTQTDAILCRRFLATFLSGLAARLDVGDQASWQDGVQPRDRIAEARQLLHALTDAPLRFLSLTLDIAGGRQSGVLSLALPQDLLKLPEQPEPDPPAPDPEWTNALRERILDSSAGLNAVLHRSTIPLSAVAKFKTGDMIPLPDTVMDHVRLEDASGRKVAEVLLGKLDGKWAVKVPDPGEVLRDINALGAAPEDPVKQYEADLEQALADEAAKPLPEID